jgi:hypothetical protein
MHRPTGERATKSDADADEAGEAAGAVDEGSCAPAADDPPAPATSPARKRLRFGVFVAVVLGLQAGPIAIQVLDLDVPLRGWRMFRGKGSDICDVRFTEHSADGRTSRLTVEQVFKATGTRAIGAQSNRLNDVSEIRALARRYCARASGSELHAVARCGAREKGWRKVLRGTEDLCRSAQ